MLFGTLVSVRRVEPARIPAATAETLKLAQPRPAVAAHRWIEAARRPGTPRA
jgi:hypothetical protein